MRVDLSASRAECQHVAQRVLPCPPVRDVRVCAIAQFLAGRRSSARGTRREEESGVRNQGSGKTKTENSNVRLPSGDPRTSILHLPDFGPWTLGLWISLIPDVVWPFALAGQPPVAPEPTVSMWTRYYQLERAACESTMKRGNYRTTRVCIVTTSKSNFSHSVPSHRSWAAACGRGGLSARRQSKRPLLPSVLAQAGCCPGVPAVIANHCGRSRTTLIANASEVMTRDVQRARVR